MKRGASVIHGSCGDIAGGRLPFLSSLFTKRLPGENADGEMKADTSGFLKLL